MLVDVSVSASGYVKRWCVSQTISHWCVILHQCQSMPTAGVSVSVNVSTRQPLVCLALSVHVDRLYDSRCHCKSMSTVGVLVSVSISLCRPLLCQSVSVSAYFNRWCVSQRKDQFMSIVVV